MHATHSMAPTFARCRSFTSTSATTASLLSRNSFSVRSIAAQISYELQRRVARAVRRTRTRHVTCKIHLTARDLTCRIRRAHCVRHTTCVRQRSRGSHAHGHGSAVTDGHDRPADDAALVGGRILHDNNSRFLEHRLACLATHSDRQPSTTATAMTSNNVQRAAPREVRCSRLGAWGCACCVTKRLAPSTISRADGVPSALRYCFQLLMSIVFGRPPACARAGRFRTACGVQGW